MHNPFSFGSDSGPRSSSIHDQHSNGIGGLFSTFTDPITKAKNWGARKFEQAAEKNKKNKADANRKMVFLMIYISFLLAYSITAMYGRNNSDIYYMQRNIVDELAGTKTMQVSERCERALPIS